MDEVTALWTFDEALSISIQLTSRTPGAFSGVNEYLDSVYEQFNNIVEYLEVRNGVLIEIPDDWNSQLEHRAYDAYEEELLTRAEPFPFNRFKD
jgi:hypothetical protein